MNQFRLMRRDRILAVATVFFLLILNSCGNANAKFRRAKIQDTSINSKEQYSKLILDSNVVHSHIKGDSSLAPYRDDILAFYQRRGYQAAWFTDSGLSISAYSFLDMLQDYQSHFADSSITTPLINLITAPRLAGDLFFNSGIANDSIELALTTAFFKYSTKALSGSTADPRDLEWYIPRNKKSYHSLLDTLVSSPAAYQEYEPSNRYYKLLKAALIKYRKLDKADGLPNISKAAVGLALGDSSTVVTDLKKYLYTTQDYLGQEQNIVYNDSLLYAVKRFQNRMGLRESGLIDTITLAEMNISIANRIKQIMLNMERLRWLPDEIPSSYILVNIPEYRLHVFDSARYQWSMSVVVGTQTTATNIFRGNLSVVSFSPYWRVPESIIRKEILPALQRNSGYLAQKNMEAVNADNEVVNTRGVNWGRFKTSIPYTIRQRPGSSNALGRVVFYFPNRFDIYLHDTPAKSFFGETNRAFSHGCIRLADPTKLAEYVFRKDSTMTHDRIQELMNGGKETKIAVKPSIPVVVGYFTAWVNHAGQLNFRHDIYGYDTKLAQEVFGK